MWRNYGPGGDGDGAVVWVQGGSGAARCLVALLWFYGESESRRWRVSEQARVRGNEARGVQITSASSWRRGPIASQHWPCGGHALWPVGHILAWHGVR